MLFCFRDTSVSYTHLDVYKRQPLDCTILEGGSDIDTSAVTGESVPVRSEVGDSLLSGMTNLNGALKCRVEKSYENSTANKIAELVRDCLLYTSS